MYLGLEPRIADFVVDRWTGDGVTSTYNLSYNPGAESGLLVHVGGTYQTPGIAYSVNNAQLVLSGPAPSGVQITAVHLGRMGSVGVPGASSVTYSALAADVQNMIRNMSYATQKATTAGQSTYSFTYTPGTIFVTRNGTMLDPATDYTAVNGTSVVLTSGVAATIQVNEEIGLLKLSSFNIADAVQKSGDIMGGPLVLAGNAANALEAVPLSQVYSLVTSKIFPISASVSANALTLTLNPTSLDFRSSTLTSGTVNTRTVSSAISLTVSSGSTLGTVNAQQARLILIAIDNAGTVELAVVNQSGGNNLDETTLISTTAEGGAGAADSANVIYSATARTNVPFRVVGFVDITEASAGTWATAPSTVQGLGGQALSAFSSLGYGQTVQDLTGSRAYGTTYYNTTGRPYFVSVGGNSTTTSASLAFAINGVSSMNQGTSVSGMGITINFIVPVGGSYSISASNTSLVKWLEIR